MKSVYSKCFTDEFMLFVVTVDVELQEQLQNALMNLEKKLDESITNAQVDKGKNKNRSPNPHFDLFTLRKLQSRMKTKTYEFGACYGDRV